MTTRQIILQSRPVGTPTQNFKIEEHHIDQIQTGSLIKRLVLLGRSHMRGRMNDANHMWPPSK
jgi:NADPH-dependent curcumin reductase CurA